MESRPNPLDLMMIGNAIWVALQFSVQSSHDLSFLETLEVISYLTSERELKRI